MVVSALMVISPREMLCMPADSKIGTPEVVAALATAARRLQALPPFDTFDSAANEVVFCTVHRSSPVSESSRFDARIQYSTAAHLNAASSRSKLHSNAFERILADLYDGAPPPVCSPAERATDELNPGSGLLPRAERGFGCFWGRTSSLLQEAAGHTMKRRIIFVHFLINRYRNPQ